MVEARLAIEIAGATVGVIGTAQINDESSRSSTPRISCRSGGRTPFARGFANRFSDPARRRQAILPRHAGTAAHRRRLSRDDGHIRPGRAQHVQEGRHLRRRGHRYRHAGHDRLCAGAQADRGSSRAGCRSSRSPPMRPPTVVQAAAASGMRGAVGKFDRAGLLAMLSEILEVARAQQTHARIAHHRGRARHDTVRIESQHGIEREAAPSKADEHNVSSSRRRREIRPAGRHVCRPSFRIEAVTPVPLGPPEISASSICAARSSQP